MAYENYTVGQFKRAWFKEDYTEAGIPKDQFEVVYTEYIDTVGAYKSDQFNLVAWIKHLENKTNTIKLFCDLQRLFIELFGVPYIEGFKILEEDGYYLEYENNHLFFEELERLEQDSKGDISEMNTSIKELEDLKASEPVVETTLKEKSQSFLRNQNTLEKIGYKIDDDKTSVERYALMIKQQNEENER